MKRNNSWKYSFIFVFALFTISACTSTNNNRKGWEVELGGCMSRVHPEKTNATADFQACFHNCNGDSDKVDACMLDHGWSEMQDVSCDTVNRFYKSTQIDGCLESSMQTNKVDHLKMNQCLAQFDEFESDISDTKAAIEELLDEQIK